jgi:hypothetical protein
MLTTRRHGAAVGAVDRQADPARMHRSTRNTDQHPIGTRRTQRTRHNRASRRRSRRRTARERPSQTSEQRGNSKQWSNTMRGHASHLGALTSGHAGPAKVSCVRLKHSDLGQLAMDFDRRPRRPHDDLDARPRNETTLDRTVVEFVGAAINAHAAGTSASRSRSPRTAVAASENQPARRPPRSRCRDRRHRGASLPWRLVAV